MTAIFLFVAALGSIFGFFVCAGISAAAYFFGGLFRPSAVHLVRMDNAGAHEPEAVLSVWLTKREASAEVLRLSMHGPGINGRYYSERVRIGESEDYPI